MPQNQEIIIVQDNPEILLSLKYNLETAGHIILGTAQSYQEAVTLFNNLAQTGKKQPIILLDNNLPYNSGGKPNAIGKKLAIQAQAEDIFGFEAIIIAVTSDVVNYGHAQFNPKDHEHSYDQIGSWITEQVW